MQLHGQMAKQMNRNVSGNAFSKMVALRIRAKWRDALGLGNIDRFHALLLLSEGNNVWFQGSMLVCCVAFGRACTDMTSIVQRSSCVDIVTELNLGV